MNEEYSNIFFKLVSPDGGSTTLGITVNGKWQLLMIDRYGSCSWMFVDTANVHKLHHWLKKALRQ